MVSKVPHVRAQPSASFSGVHAFNACTNDRLNVSRFQNLPIRRSAEDRPLVASDSSALCGRAPWLPYSGLRELIAFYPDSGPFSGVME
jgi:hypothetical protein